MSYQQQGGQQGYGQYNPYGNQGQGNPYADQGNPYGGQQPSYGNQQPSGGLRPQQTDLRPQQTQGSSYYDEEQGRPTGQGYEMANMNGNDPNRILNETRAVDRGIDEIEIEIERLKQMHDRAIRDTDARRDAPVQKEVTRISDGLIKQYRGLTDRITRMKQDPESGNPRNAPQVGKVDRRLKKMIQTYQRVDSDYRAAIKDAIARQYRIVRPDASDAEVREVTEDTNNTQIFSQALINSDRRGQAQSVANNVRNRHEAIAKIEQDMLTLATLFQDLEAAVVQQEPAVTQIEQRGEEVTEHVAKANTELTGAVDKARAARRKKWWCLGIAVLIVIIIAVVVAVVVTVTNNNK